MKKIKDLTLQEKENLKKTIELKNHLETEKLIQKNVIYDSKKWLLQNGFSNTVDIVLMSIIDDELGVLLIKREDKNNNPYSNFFALPGGYVNNSDVDADSAAKRELKEETGLSDIYLEQLYTFTKKGRDPREKIANSPVRIWSVAYVALIDHTKVNAVAGSDASETKWFKISELPKLAFDHEEIINMAIDRVRGKLNYSNFGFELLPNKFTINQLRDVFEKILGEKIDRNNFRTKVLKMEILIETKDKKKEGPGQPSPYFKLDHEKLKMIKGKSLF